jgi:uncharacterized protein (DUF1499 family)
MAQQGSRLAAVAGVIGALSLAIGVGGAVLAHLRVLAPIQGFGMFGFGAVVLGALSLLTGIGALFTTRDAGGRGRAWFALAVGLLMLGLVARGASPGAGLPRINDITTNPDDPPTYEQAQRDPATSARDYSYPAGFAAQQRAAYPDLAPIALAVPPDRAFDVAKRILENLGMKITLAEKERGLIEAQDESYLFRFVDDVSIRVRSGAGGGAVVDIRSKSRDGQGDVGANARRIRVIAAELAATS